jgi:hypothetical protein
LKLVSKSPKKFIFEHTMIKEKNENDFSHNFL